MMKIQIRTVEHSKQPYDTVGMWKMNKDGLLVSVSDMKNKKYEFLTAIHETIEATLCIEAGITEKEVTEWDETYEICRSFFLPLPCGCKVTDTSEPGHDVHSPYYFQHRFATEIEKTIAKKMKVNWKEYSKKVNSL